MAINIKIFLRNSVRYDRFRKKDLVKKLGQKEVVQMCAILFCLSKCVCGEKEREVEYILHFGYMFISTKSFTTVVSVGVAQGE